MAKGSTALQEVTVYITVGPPSLHHKPRAIYYSRNCRAQSLKTKQRKETNKQTNNPTNKQKTKTRANITFVKFNSKKLKTEVL